MQPCEVWCVRSRGAPLVRIGVCTHRCDYRACGVYRYRYVPAKVCLWAGLLLIGPGGPAGPTGTDLALVPLFFVAQCG